VVERKRGNGLHEERIVSDRRKGGDFAASAVGIFMGRHALLLKKARNRGKEGGRPRGKEKESNSRRHQFYKREILLLREKAAPKQTRRRSGKGSPILSGKNRKGGPSI